jgi:hypothetical protein
MKGFKKRTDKMIPVNVLWKVGYGRAEDQWDDTVQSRGELVVKWNSIVEMEMVCF